MSKPPYARGQDEYQPRPRIGVSTCLLGQQVRYDGGHKLERWIVQILAKHVDLVDTCPEVEIGLGTPREPIQLVGVGNQVRLLGQGSRIDHTDKMVSFSRERVQTFTDLDGYILKSRSPSCGLARIPIWKDDGQADRSGIGLFAGALVQEHPGLAVEDEGRLNDPGLRDQFLRQVWTSARWHALGPVDEISPSRLQVFHRVNKFLLMAFSPQKYRELGKLAANSNPWGYGSTLPTAFERPTSVGRHVNVLQHSAGMLAQKLSADERSELAEVIAAYRASTEPLASPLTLLRHHARLRAGWPPADWLAEQSYLTPFPKGLMGVN